jgi:hypothetical protein
MWVCLFTTKIHPAHMFPLGKTLVGEYNHFRALISPFTVTQLLLLLVASSTKLQQLRAIPLAIAATISTTAGALLSNISFNPCYHPRSLSISKRSFWSFIMSAPDGVTCRPCGQFCSISCCQSPEQKPRLFVCFGMFDTVSLRLINM